MADESIPIKDSTNATRDIAGDTVGGLFYQRIKLDLGGDGALSPVVDAIPVSAAALPLPTGASTETTLVAASAKLPATLGQKAMAASMAVVVASDQGAVPVSAASLPLPTGAATAAKQPALGTAGTASADVITVQGKASMTPVLVDGSATTQPVSGTVTANAGTNLNTSALATSALQGGGIGSLTETAPTTDTASSGINGRLQRIAQRVSSLIALLPTALGSNGGMKVELVSSLAASTNSVALDARAGVGASPFRLLDSDESEDEVKSSAGTLFSLVAVNRAAAERFLKIYDGTAAAVTVGTTTPVFVVSIPPTPAGFVWESAIGMAFSSGICIAATTGVADTDTGAPAVNDVVVSGTYK